MPVGSRDLNVLGSTQLADPKAYHNRIRLLHLNTVEEKNCYVAIPSSEIKYKRMSVDERF